jgi:hypothetical protein
MRDISLNKTHNTGASPFPLTAWLRIRRDEID